jgi:Tfp pilus assembly protein PilV
MTTNATTESRRSGERLWPIGMWLAVVGVAGLAAFAAGRLYERNRGRQAARSVIAQTLLQQHWQKLEAMSEFRPRIAQLGGEFSHSPPAWQATIVSQRSGTPTTLDAFDARARSEIEAGADEVWRPGWHGESRYAAAIRASDGCIACHPVSAAGKPIRVNDLLGVAFVREGSGAN